jgi:hypothetical protein
MSTTTQTAPEPTTARKPKVQPIKITAAKGGDKTVAPKPGKIAAAIKAKAAPKATRATTTKATAAKASTTRKPTSRAG